MNNDDRLVPRDEPIPVSVRRPLGAANVPLDPSLLPPQGAPQAGPPAAAAPHIIYINNIPAPAASPVVAAVPAAAAPAQTIHHHYYNTPPAAPQSTPQTTQRISFRMRTPPSQSALGMASLALGILACVVCWVPWLGLIAVPVGAIGALLGLLGVLVSLLFRKSSAGLPLAGIFTCCLAAGISIASTRTLPYWRRQLENGLSTVLPHGITLPHESGPSAPPPPPPAPIRSLFDPSPTSITPSPTPAPWVLAGPSFFLK